MNPIFTAIAAAALLGGCGFLSPKPPPVIAEPPRAGQPEPAPADNGGSPASEVKSSSSPSVDAKPSGQVIPGHWGSKTVTGPGSENVRRVEMIFESGGGFSGVLLIENAGKQRFAALEGTWLTEADHLAVKYSDGRARSWSVTWDAELLVLKDGEAELRLERIPE